MGIQHTRKYILASPGLTVILAVGVGWWRLEPRKDVPRKNVRDSDGCKCEKGCACNHCSGEKDAKKKGKCDCKHCAGVPGGDDGKNGCACK